VLPAQALRRPSRFLAINAAAPAPKRRIIGGAGTGVPPFEPPLLLPPLDEDELDELDEELLELDEEELLLPEEPKLLEPPVDEVEVDAPLELDPPVEVEEVEVDPPWLEELPWLDEP
jgi:hypothetical protein